MEAHARFMHKARLLGHDTTDKVYMRLFVNFILGRSRDDNRSPSPKEYDQCTRDLSFWAIGAEGWQEFIRGNTTPRKEWLAGFEKRWHEKHPDEPLPENVVAWMKICRSSRFDAEIETKGSQG